MYCIVLYVFVCLGSRMLMDLSGMRGVPQHVLYVFVCLGSRMRGVPQHVLYVFVCLGSRMLMDFSTCIVCVCLFRFSNAHGFLDMYCMCLSV